MAAGKQEDIEHGEISLHQEIRAPLITNTCTNVVEEEQEKNGCNEKKQDRYMVYLSTAVAVSGSFAFGSCYSLFGSISTFGAMTGAITSGPISDYIGRKGAMRMSSAFSVIGWLAIFFAEGALFLDTGRVATGYGMGVFSYVVPVFIAEIAPRDLRGALTTINELMICAAVTVAFIIGTMITWRALALTGIIPCAILLLGLFIIPESPRWLAKIGDQKEFEISLCVFMVKMLTYLRRQLKSRSIHNNLKSVTCMVAV